MRLLLLILVNFFTLSSFSQSAGAFFINDFNKIKREYSLVQLISENKFFGYNLYKNKSGEYIFKDEINNPIIIFIKRSEVGEYLEDEGFPEYTVGKIVKSYFFFTDSNINNATLIPWKIITDVYSLPYENVTSKQINNFYKFIKNKILKNYNPYKLDLDKIEYKLNYKTVFGANCDLLEVYKFAIDSLQFSLSSGEYNDDDYKCMTIITQRKDVGMVCDALIEFNKSANAFQRTLDDHKYFVQNKDLRKINQFDLDGMVNFFLDDCRKNDIFITNNFKIHAIFETIKDSTIALSLGMNNDSLIEIKVDPIKWNTASSEKRWYVMYHELGHDVLNLEHGQGGKMMFNFVDKDYSWDDFFNDKNYMFEYKKNSKRK